MENNEDILYSVWIRKGPDVIHYDMILTENALVLSYIGEHWERFRPRSGLQKRVDLYLYKITKLKRRSHKERSPMDIVLPLCSIKAVVLHRIDKIGVCGKPVTNTCSPESRLSPSILRILLKDGKSIDVCFSQKVYKIAKKITEKLRHMMVKACQEDN
jgi:hypothetical protein